VPLQRSHRSQGAPAAVPVSLARERQRPAEPVASEVESVAVTEAERGRSVVPAPCSYGSVAVAAAAAEHELEVAEFEPAGQREPVAFAALATVPESARVVLRVMTAEVVALRDHSATPPVQGSVEQMPELPPGVQSLA
jgi:hypothetical protein